MGLRNTAKTESLVFPLGWTAASALCGPRFYLNPTGGCWGSLSGGGREDPLSRIWLFETLGNVLQLSVRGPGPCVRGHQMVKLCAVSGCCSLGKGKDGPQRRRLMHPSKWGCPITYIRCFLYIKIFFKKKSFPCSPSCLGKH